jgi:hypothetical protein
MKITESLKLVFKIISYNLKIVFANKFVYFLTAAFLFYLIIITIMLFSEGSPDSSDIYNTLIFPGILILFYPVVFNIQNDKDNRMLEIIFGVPNYRYKVYIIRFGITMLLLLALMTFMGWFSYFVVIKVPVFEIVGQLMYPLFFLSSLAFLFSTLTRNGNGTAVVMVIIGLIFWFLSESLRGNKWNIFLNPFEVPDNINVTIWSTVIAQNRMILAIGSVISILWGLINLQRREKFV